MFLDLGFSSLVVVFMFSNLSFFFKNTVIQTLNLKLTKAGLPKLKWVQRVESYLLVGFAPNSFPPATCTLHPAHGPVGTLLCANP